MQRVHTNDESTEAMILAKGKTAPRITPADIEAGIISQHFFTAAQGSQAACPQQPVHSSLPLLTFCVLVLSNGFTVTGESACASPENFDEQIGRKIARENAVQKIWPLMGYELRTRIAAGKVELANGVVLPTAVSNTGLPPHLQRVVNEKSELDDNRQKLNVFINSSRFADLDESERGRMREQYVTMSKYSDILGERISAATTKAC